MGTNNLGPLPAITEQASINGYTQPGASPNTLAVGDDAKLMVELNGTNAGFGENGLNLTASDSTIKGLAINRFSGDNIRIDGDSNKVQGNFVGTDPSGTLSGLGGGAEGVSTRSALGKRSIGGATTASRNIISGNQQGVIVSDGSNNTIGRQLHRHRQKRQAKPRQCLEWHQHPQLQQHHRGHHGRGGQRHLRQP